MDQSYYPYAPVIVPWITDPFFSSTVTVSLLSFIKNLGVHDM